MIKSFNYYYLVLLTSFFVFISQNTFSQNKTFSNVHLFLEGGLNFGGKVSANNFSYKSGENIECGLMKTINEKTNLGIGIGMSRLDYDYFYPIAFRIESKIFNNENFIFLFKTGYSFATTDAETLLFDVNLVGGLFMETGRAWEIKLNDQVSLLSSLSFKYQFAQKEFETATSDFYENEDFMFIMFKLGIVFQ